VIALGPRLIVKDKLLSLRSLAQLYLC
jgi:hypothetical protein